MSKFAKEYKGFMNSPAGAEFLTTISTLIDSNHENAENATDQSMAFAYTQRAKGVREVLNHLNSVTAERKT